jgi:hypothetical protein
MKPTWHTGVWTEEDTLALIDELTEAQAYRSLTNEELAWLEAAE